MKDRIRWIDISKGLAIILVVLGHAISDDARNSSMFYRWLYIFIYSFHMPLLFFLSGYCYSKFNSNDNLKILFKKKVKSLLKPWIVYSILAFVVFRIVNAIPMVYSMLDGTSMGFFSIKDYAIRALSANNPYCFHLWFIYVLFFVTISTAIFSCKKNEVKVNLIIAVVFMCIYICTHDFANVFSYYVYEMVWFNVGIAFCNYEKNKKILSKHYEIMMIIPVMVFSYLRCLDLEIINLIWKVAKFPLVLGAIFCFISLSRIIENKRNYTLTTIGTNSFVIYLLHQPVCVISVFLSNSVLELPVILSLIIGVITSFGFPALVLFLARKYQSIGRLCKLMLNI